MLFQAIKQYQYKADAYVVERDEQQRPVSETFVGTVLLSLDTTESDSLNIDSRAPLYNGTLLRNIKDREGSLVYPAVGTGLTAGEVYQVYMERPLLSAFGTLEGYSSRARKLAAG